MRTKSAIRLLVAIGCLLGAATSTSFGWGEVDFENFPNTLIYTNSVHNGPATGLITGDHAYYFELFEALTNTTDLTHLDDDTPLDAGGWVNEGAAGTNTPTPGIIDGNEHGLYDAYYKRVLAGEGYPANFVVVGWSANLGDSWRSYAGHPGSVRDWWNNGNPTNGVVGWFGISDIAQDVIVGGFGYPVPTIFGPTPGYQVQGFTLNKYDGIPEPSAPFQITSIVRTNASDLLITWNTTGITNIVQVQAPVFHGDGSYNGNFTDLTYIVVTTATTNFVDAGVLTNKTVRYYRVRSPQ